ncbi:Gfo/Idh/MocA family protein [Caldanaerobius polysaccharolyticus]|uniref:Gfo/Idh/MocA family protein n=1 Tax=Caldanaerobius polysaccharolyticus TaxID=44256 RepID=UPI00047B586D|nr:Gfo/Idh/MocA family oxidoreductase [Caldanaerobius polysaccharolyticus]
MLKVGIIGAGGIGTIHAKCYKSIPEAKVVAVADIIPERAKELASMFNAEYYDHGDKIIERPDIDVVDICVPTYLHCDYTLKAASAKKHVLCEKPMALSIEEGRKMIEATNVAGVTFMVAHVLRYFPEYENAYGTIKKGLIGLPKIVRTYRGGPNPAVTREWYGIAEKSGGAIQDMLIHDIDFLKMCFGPVKEVYAKGNILKRKDYKDPEYDLVILEFYNGVIAHLVADWSGSEDTPFVTKLEIAGTEGLIEYDSSKSVPLNVRTTNIKSEKSGVAVPESPLDTDSNPYTREIRLFLNAVEFKKEPPISGNEALESLGIALAAIKSIKLDRPVKPEEVLK